MGRRDLSYATRPSVRQKGSQEQITCWVRGKKADLLASWSFAIFTKLNRFCAGSQQSLMSLFDP